MRRLWVFDLDDTLIHTCRAYMAIRRQAVELIRAALGPNAPTVEEALLRLRQHELKRIHEINPDTGTPYFYCRDRFPRSLRDVYFELCARLHEPAVREIGEQLLALGYSVYDPKRYANDIKPGVRELLAKLRGNRFMLTDRVVVLTKGDARVQQEKLDALKNAGLRWDDEIIVEYDKRPEFERLIRSTERRCISVGDNYDSDIRPAIELGYYGVWVHLFNWETDHKKDSILEEAKRVGVRIIGELGDLPGNPLEL